MKRLHELDGLRGISIFMIAFMYHFKYVYGIEEMNNPIFEKICSYGYLGVELFFGISGFLMFSLYFKSKCKEEGFYGFIKQRLKRLLPLVWISTIIVGTIDVVRIGAGLAVQTTNTLLNFIFNILGVQTFLFPAVETAGQTFNQPLWFVSVIIFCYILFFWVRVKAKSDREETGIWIIIAIIAVWISINEPYDNRLPVINIWTATGIFPFIVGGSIAKYRKCIEKNRKLSIFISLIFAVIWVVSIMCFPIILGNIRVTFSLLVLPGVLIISIYVKMISRLLTTKPLQRIGLISFSIFIWDFPVKLMFLTANDILNLNFSFATWKFWIIAFVITLIVSLISFALFEVKLQSYLKYKKTIGHNY